MKILSFCFPPLISPSAPPQALSFAVTQVREARSPESEVTKLSPDREGHRDGIHNSEGEEANTGLQKKKQQQLSGIKELTLHPPLSSEDIP